MHSSFDGLMTIFKSHLITAGCIEVDVSSMDDDLPPTVEVPLVSDVASKGFTIVSEAVLRLPVEDSNDRVHNYSRVLCLCHLTSLAMEFTDAWSEGGVLWKCCCFISLPGDEPSTHWRLSGFRCSWLLSRFTS